MSGSPAAPARPTLPPARFGFRLRVIAAAAAAILMLFVDPFGVSDSTEGFAYGKFNEVFGPVLYGEGAREAISVVLVDDVAMADIKDRWPLSFLNHATALDAVRRQRPRAVVIDLLFLDRREPTVTELAAVLADYAADGIPVFLAAGGTSPEAPSGVLEELRPHVRPVTPYTASVRNATDYTLVPDRALTAADLPQPLPSMALAVYEELCRGPSPRPPSCAGFAQADFARPMRLLWGQGPPEYGALLRGEGPPADQLWRCAPSPDGLLARLGKAVTGDDGRADPASVPARPPTCAFHATVPVNYLLKDEPSRYAGMIEGRVVFYGQSLAGLQDMVDAPGFGHLAGVYKHAMALDNLMTWGDEYLAAESVGFWGAANGKMMEVVAVFALYVLYYAAAIWFAKLRRPVTGPFQDEKTTVSGVRELCRYAGAFRKSVYAIVVHAVRSAKDPEWWKAAIPNMLCASVGPACWTFAVLSAAGLLYGIIHLQVEVLRIAPMNWIELIGTITVPGLLTLWDADPDEGTPDAA